MFVVNWALKYAAQKNHWNKYGTDDPYYEEYEIENAPFFRPKKAKKPRGIPEGISPGDTAILKKMRRRAYHLDMIFHIFGYRFGWGGIISIVPVVGDLASVALSLLLFKMAREVDGGLPLEVQGYLLLNIIIDFVVGLIPFVGTLVEVMYKANSRNALVLEKYLAAKGQVNILKLSEISNGKSSTLESDVSSIGSKNIPKRKQSAKVRTGTYSAGKDPEKVSNLKQRNLDL